MLCRQPISSLARAAVRLARRLKFLLTLVESWQHHLVSHLRPWFHGLPDARERSGRTWKPQWKPQLCGPLPTLVVLIALSFFLTQFSAMVEGQGVTGPSTDQQAAGLTAEQRTAAEGVVREFLGAYTVRSVEQAMATWSEQAPGREQRRESLERLFSQNEKLTATQVEFLPCEADGDHAAVGLRFQLQSVGRDGVESNELIERYVELIGENGTWRIWRYVPLREDAHFLRRIYSVRSRPELNRLIRARYPTEFGQASMIFFAFRQGTPEQRQTLLDYDPFEALAQPGFVVDLNATSYQSLMEAHGDEARLAEAENLNQQAFEVARYLEDPYQIALSRLQRSLLLLQKPAADGRALAELARVELERLQRDDGLAAAHLILGRWAVEAGDRKQATEHFETAERYFEFATSISESERKPLGEIWLGLHAQIQRHQQAVWDAKTERDTARSIRARQELITVARQLYGRWHPRLVDQHLLLAYSHLELGESAAALESAREASAVSERVLPAWHWSHRDCAEAIQLTQRLIDAPPDEQRQISAALQARNAAAYEPQADRQLALCSLAIADLGAILGSDTLWIADLHLQRGQLYAAAGDFNQALADYQRAVEILAQAKHYDQTYQQALDSMIELHRTRWRQTGDVEALQAALAAAEQQVASWDSRSEADPYQSISDAARRDEIVHLLTLEPAQQRQMLKLLPELSSPPQSTPAEQVTRLRDVLAQLQPLLGESSFTLFNQRRRLSLYYFRAEQFREALAELDLCAKYLRDRNYPENIFFWAEVHLARAGAYGGLGDWKRMDESLQRAEAVLVNWDTVETAAAESFMAVQKMVCQFRLSVGDAAGAERAILRALLVAKRQLFDRNHPDYFGSKLPVNVQDLRDPKARGYLVLLQQLTLVYLAQGDYRRADRFYEGFIGVAPQIYQAESDRRNLATLYFNYALIREKLGDHQRARALIEDALALFPDDATYLHQAASIALRTGDAQSALELLNRALLSWPGELSTNSPEQDLVNQLPDLDLSTFFPDFDGEVWYLRGLVQRELGDLPAARRAFMLSLALETWQLDNVLTFRSDQDTLDYRRRIQQEWQNLVSLAVHSSATTADVEQTWNWSLATRGRAWEAFLVHRTMQEALEGDPNLRRWKEELSERQRELAELAVSPPPELSRQAMEARSQRLQEEVRGLTNRLRRQAAEISPPLPAITLAQLREVRPDNTAIVEIRRGARWIGSVKDLRWKSHYFAFVLPPGKTAEPQIFDLGPAEVIDAAVSELRENLASTPRLLEISDEADVEENYRQLARQTYDLVVAPLAPALGDAARICVISDGELQGLAWETLVDTQSNYVIDRYEISYLTTARDLVRAPIAPGAGTVVFAGPDYGGTGGRNGWRILPHAREEADVLSEALENSPFGPVRQFLGSAATEDELKRIHGPRILHLATHGYFVTDLSGLLAESSGLARGTGTHLHRLRKQTNPYLRGGLVFAGANEIAETAGSSRQDGWLTAEEVTSLDLRGTELVVLSACETGLGEVTVGESVEGLRQAFLRAGARTIVTSLYAVPDQATRQLMTHFYSNVSSETRWSAALRQAALSTRNSRRDAQQAAHPFFWGSFICVGAPN